MSLAKDLFEKEDEITFVVSVILLIAVTPRLIDILIRPWSINGGLFPAIAGLVWFFDHAGISKIVNISFGFYLINMAFLVLDEKKRIQTLMLSLVLIVGIFIVMVGQRVPNVHFDAISILAGLVVGIFLSSDKISHGDVFKKILKGKKEFKKPAKNLTFFSLLIIFVTFFSYYGAFLSDNRAMVNGGYFGGDLIAVSIFFIFFTKLMNFELKSSSIIVLGPKNSGKSLFLAGAYLTALEAEGKKQISPSSELIELIDEMQKTEWPSRTDKIREYSFIFRHGKLFPKDIQFYSYDYPGPYLEHLDKFMQNKVTTTNSTDSSSLSPDFDQQDTISQAFNLLASKIEKCDKLVLLIDGARYPNFTEMGIKYYLKILNFLNTNHFSKEYYIVVTKSDLFLEAYEESTNERVITNESYEDFKKFVNNRFTENTNIKALLKDTQCDFLYPIFYHTIKLKDGSRIPLRSIKENIWPPFGYGPLMEDLIK